MARTVEIAVEVEPRYSVRIGAGVLAEVRAFVGARKVAVISDRTVARFHGKALALDAPMFELEAGEQAKSLESLGRALDFLAERELDRSSVVIALGGGVVGDLGGLAASLYMRGVDVVQCPTTLLAQVDASVGGKTAINLEAGKNLAGTFHQPRAVFADTATLATLDASEFRSGLGEVVKSALLDGEDFFAWLESNAAKLAARDFEALTGAVERSVKLKARVVASDPTERGARKSLNLGHTFAHAIEHVAGYGRVPHGVAVAVGLRLALELGLRNGALEDRTLAARLEQLLAALELPRSLAELRVGSKSPLEADRLVDAMRIDKKGRSGSPRFVLLVRAGRAALDVEVDRSLVREVLA